MSGDRFPKRLLVTQGMKPFAQRVAKLFAPETIWYASSEDLPQVLIDTGKYVAVPKGGAPTFVHEVLKRCLDLEIDVLLPLGQVEQTVLASVKPLFSEYGIAVWVPDEGTLHTLPSLENPPRQLPLIVLHQGVDVHTGVRSVQYDTISGVFLPSDSGDELAVCCVEN